MKFLLVAALAFLAASAAHGLPSSSYRKADSGSSEANYNFAWGVDDDDSYVHTSHRESRKGDNTEGEYTLVEPDGSTRKVTYYVNGDSGFIATVNGVRWPQEAGSTGARRAGGDDSDSGERVAAYAKPRRIVYVQPAPAPAPKPYRPAPKPAPARRASSSEESTGGATVRIQAPGYSVAY